MPGPAIYVVAIVAGVAAGVAFKEFVYDPHLAPKFEHWGETFAAYRKERRRRRAHPHSYSHSRSDDEVHDNSVERKSSVQPESMVEQEMQNLNLNGVLRQRKTDSKNLTLEMLDKPNTFIPFEPLSPEKPPSGSPPPPDPFASRSNIALPIGRLPTPVSDRTLSSSGARGPPPAQPGISYEARASAESSFSSPQPLVHSPQSTFLSTSREIDAASAPESRASSRLASEYDFVPDSPSDSVSALESRSITPFSDSRATTPSTDIRSEVSLDFVGSESASSDAELLYEVDSDVEPAELARSHAGSDTEQVHQGINSLRVPRVDMRSEAGSDDWERVSDEGRRSVSPS